MDIRVCTTSIFKIKKIDCMPLALITLTEHGITTAKRIIKGINGEADLFLPEKFNNSDVSAKFYSESLSELVVKLFNEYKGIIFIMATGIVVRVIAPNIKSKYSDPAVVVIDDVGRYVISLLSGHEGGANNLACKVANILSTDAVITTGTEAEKKLIVGVGCRRGVSSVDIINAVKSSLEIVNSGVDSVRLIATIDLKADEVGLIEASKVLDVPLRIVAREEIANCLIEYNKSDFVKEKIGISAVSEPAAVLGGRKTKLILTKQKFPGITVAIAEENFMW